MKHLLLVALMIILVNSCSSEQPQSHTAPAETDTATTAANAVDTVQSDQLIDVVEEVPTEIPSVSDLDFATLTEERSHAYGGGDCVGAIRQYSDPNMQFVSDSMSCGEYGYVYTHFFMDKAGKIGVVHKIDYEVEMDAVDTENNRKFHESVYDFRAGRALMLVRKETTASSEYPLAAVPYDTFELSDPAKERGKWEGIRDAVWNQRLAQD